MNFIEAKIVSQDGRMAIDTDGFRVKLPEEFHARLEPYVGKPVVFGVRPEDIALHDPGVDAAEERTLRVCADVVETLGSEIFVYLSCGKHSLVARMEVPDSALRVGQELQVDLKMLKTHVFDKETQQAIV